MKGTLQLLGRVIGAIAGFAASLCWVFAMWVPTAGLTLAGVSFVVALLMAIIALFAMIAAVRGHFVVLTLMFLASFFPIGAFLMTTDHWLKWVGALDIGFITAAFLMWVSSRSAKIAATSTAAR
jgi:hypothetical protein